MILKHLRLQELYTTDCQQKRFVSIMLRLRCSSANYKLWSTFIPSLNVSDFFKTELNSEVKKHTHKAFSL